MGNKSGQDVSLANKSDPTKAQVYTLTGNPVDAGTYVDYPVVWKSTGSGGAFPAQRTTVDVISTNVTAPVTGMKLTTAIGNVTADPKQSVTVIATAPVLMMKIHMGETEIAGQQIIFDYAYPFLGKDYTNPGLTIRQWYATHAMTGFIAASNTNAANLIGRLAVYAFQVADSMIAFEEKERQGYTIPVVGGDRNAQAPKPTVDVGGTPPTAAEEQIPSGRSIRSIWPREIIS
jgi:hypothetical protein